MVDIKPFKGLLYDPEKIKDMRLVTTPPYDEITEEDQKRYYDNSPYNIIRIILGTKKPADTPQDNEYTRAAGYLSSWRKSRILNVDSDPCIYIYEQEYTIPKIGTRKRRGFTSLVKLEELSRGIVRPHEKTFPGPKEDRLKLMRHVKANIEPIFCTYDNPKVPKILEKFQKKKPDMEFSDEKGFIERLWRITEQKAIEDISREMKSIPIFIADGHHRYETALNYRNERYDTEEKVEGTAPYDYRMINMVDQSDPGLVILATHRLIRKIPDFSIENTLHRISVSFNVKEIETDGQITDRIQEELAQELESGKHTFGIYMKGLLAVARIKGDSILKEIEKPGCSNAYNHLDTRVLEKLIINKALGISEIIKGDNLSFTRWIDSAIDMVDSGKYQMAVLLSPTTMEEVKEISNAREKMPQKSTHFYPKLLTGLVMYPFE